jgi:hypothetical protein
LPTTGYFTTAAVKTLTKYAVLPKVVPEFMFRLTVICLDQLTEHQLVSLSHQSIINCVSESCFIELLAGFSKPDMTVKILSA